MPRIARVVLPGHPHHVTQRGVRSMDVFRDDDDRLEYLSLMRGQADRHGISIISYCLMSNHVHLIAVPEDSDALARGLGEAHRLYTRFVNSAQGVRGYLFQGRFHSCPLDERHLIAAVRYIERNPVRARMVRVPWRYRWSSAAFHVGNVPDDPLVGDRTLNGLVDDWRELLRSDPDEEDVLRKTVRTGRPCGDERFIRSAEKRTGRNFHTRSPGRPKKQVRDRCK